MFRKQFPEVQDAWILDFAKQTFKPFEGLIAKMTPEAT
jgi:hypothetical protein